MFVSETIRDDLGGSPGIVEETTAVLGDIVDGSVGFETPEPVNELSLASCPMRPRPNCPWVSRLSMQAVERVRGAVLGPGGADTGAPTFPLTGCRAATRSGSCPVSS